MRITLKVKIFTVVISLIMLALFMGIFSVISMGNASKTTEDISKKYIYVLSIHADIDWYVMDFRRFYYLIQKTPTKENLKKYEEIRNQIYTELDKLTSFMQDETNKKLMPRVAEVVPKYRDAVSTYITYAMNQLILRTENYPKEQQLTTAISEVVKNEQQYRNSLEKMIYDSTTPEEALKYFSNYDRISDVGIDMGDLRSDLLKAIANNSVEELLKIEPLIKDVSTKLHDIRDNIKNRNLLVYITNMINEVEELSKTYGDLKVVYQEMDKIAKDRASSMAAMIDASTETENTVDAMIERTSGSAIKSISIANMMVLTLLVLMAIIAVASLIIIQKTVLSPIAAFVDAARNLTTGDKDLTIRLQTKTKDELLDLASFINSFIGSVQDIVKEVKEAANDVASGNSQLAATMEEFSATFNSQAEQVDNIVVDMGVIKNNSEDATNEMGINLNKIDETTNKTIEGQSQLNHVKNTMVDISDNTKKLSKTLDNLLESSTQIGEILTVINDIADQTNLLALNAAIEAARAGDAGRGFAVVADEVRKLAERTTKATSEIEGIISTLQHESEQAASAMRSTGTSVSAGVDTIEETAASFNLIVDGINNVTNSTHHMMSSFEEQNNTIQDVTDKTNSIANGIEESNAAVNEVTITVDHLQKRTEKLKTLVEQFKA